MLFIKILKSDKILIFLMPDESLSVFHDKREIQNTQLNEIIDYRFVKELEKFDPKIKIKIKKPLQQDPFHDPLQKPIFVLINGKTDKIIIAKTYQTEFNAPGNDIFVYATLTFTRFKPSSQKELKKILLKSNEFNFHVIISDPKFSKTPLVDTRCFRKTTNHAIIAVNGGIDFIPNIKLVAKFYFLSYDDDINNTVLVYDRKEDNKRQYFYLTWNEGRFKKVNWFLYAYLGYYPS